MDVLDLADITPGTTELVGGKAAGLAALIAAGERVPAGFCLTTGAYRSGAVPERAVLAAYERLGGGPVAVRSSATAEDSPGASFAGQQDTVLDVRGRNALLAAIRQCWASLDSERAVAYRAGQGQETGDEAMAVVVQRMIVPTAAGVMFTANPLTGTRTETVVDAVPGLGTGVVDGTMDTDHYVLPGRGPLPGRRDHGCLSPDQLHELRATARRVQRALGSPQDIEFAYDAEGTLWLLQSRAITTLFPLPPGTDPVQDDAVQDDPRVYLEVGHMQGLRRPVTPMGVSVLRTTTRRWLHLFGVDDAVVDTVLVDIGGRLFLDLTGVVRSPRLRSGVPAMAQVYGPAVARGLRRVLEDPRYGPRPPRRGQRVFSPEVTARLLLAVVPASLLGALRALARPAAARERAFRELEQVRRQRWAAPADTASRIRSAADLQDATMTGPMLRSLPPLWAALLAQGVAGRLLHGILRPGELNATLRGMPHNVTTQMDLKLWSVAGSARTHRDLLLGTAPDELAARFLRGELPELGLTAFLEEYGLRGSAEVDVGSPRWADDPTPVFAALSGYLQVTDPGQAPPARFARAADEAEAALADLVGRARRTRPLRARLAGALLRRSRELAGLRELPKFLWLTPLAQVRGQLLTAGAELTERGLLEQAEDIMFLTLDEALDAAHGTDFRALVTRRRREHDREVRRRQVPGLLLSDGTNPQALPDDTAAEHGPDVLVGQPAATGVATGPARIVQHPSEARLRPGDILVAPTTDPGWTPLFLTLGGLITETGSTIAHGPTVAREYGIPAVICVPDATTRLVEGQTVTIDGASGVIRLHPTEPVTGHGAGK
ncbi:pyruvate, water dikinase [Kocuria sp. CNJ-770]|uniref:PEP/pyruvate-binding domain-containing protein n=1 Tax=Kocuria sp. CNJ-770 TaxID=1904964 RepID=UPI0009613391|nr:PEP/pyruvate-binding domain-containing protein [Kocuria sp. CNJ-770]OLT08278.1 pyruvate, water dikinase [Kocuria sp. CNJ-770]